MEEFTLIVDISADGETVEGEVQGIHGKRCANIVALLDKVGEEIEHRHTADWDKPEPVRIGGRTNETLLQGRGW